MSRYEHIQQAELHLREAAEESAISHELEDHVRVVELLLTALTHATLATVDTEWTER